MKVKSIKVDSGYIKYGWYEEVNEFEGEEKLRSIKSIADAARATSPFLHLQPAQQRPELV